MVSTFRKSAAFVCPLAASDDWQDLAIRLSGSDQPVAIKALRLDPTDGPGTLLFGSLSIGLN